MNDNKFLTDDLQAVFEAGVACVRAAEHVLNWNSPERRTTLVDAVAALDAAYQRTQETKEPLPRNCGLTIACNFHALVLQQARKVIQAAELNAEAGGKVVSLLWDRYFPARPNELETAMEQEVWDSAPEWSDLMLPSECAKLANMSYSTFCRRVEAGRIRVKKEGPHDWRVCLNDI